MGKNWNRQTVLGESRCCWVFPIDVGKYGAKGDGIVFIKNKKDGESV